jgi:hypothetical protein
LRSEVEHGDAVSGDIRAWVSVGVAVAVHKSEAIIKEWERKRGDKHLNAFAPVKRPSPTLT